jgi:AraC-like DNA-binding protein
MGTELKDGRGVWFCSTLSTHLALHSHVGPELNLLMSGRLTYEIGGERREVRAGELLVIPQGITHQILEASPDAAFWVLELSPTDALPWLVSPSTFFTEEGWVRAFVSVSRKLWLRPAPLVENELWQALLETLRGGPPEGSPRLARLHPAVERARAICQSELASELCMTELGKRAGISPSRLSHLFQEQLGITPLQYRNFCRVQYFIQRHGESDASLMRAALRAGFGSYPQFHRSFQQVCGAPPAAHLGRLLSDAWMSPERTLPKSVA